MANLRAINQPNPFWEWVADMDNARRSRGGPSEDNGEGPSGSRENVPETRNEKQPQDSKDVEDEYLPAYDDDKTPLGDDFERPPQPPSPPRSPPPPDFNRPPHTPSSPPPHSRRGSWGGRGPRGGHHHRGGRHGHHGPHGHGPWQGGPPFMGGHWGGGRGWGGRGWGGMGGHPGWAKLFGNMNMEGLNMEALGQFMRDNFGLDAGGQQQTSARQAGEDKDFKPPADLFDTPDAYIVHLSLAGARKEDLGVSWNPESQEIQVGGVIHRPGDEEFLKTIALEERNIGVFERNIKLGTKSQPAAVNADGITAKMEDGVLMIRVPKEMEFVEVKHVDIE